MEKVRKFKLMYGLVSLGYLALGLVIVLYPNLSMMTICYAFGILTLIYGIFHIVSYSRKSGEDSIFRFDLVIGIVAILLSLWILIKPEGILKVLPIVLGVFIFMSALVKLQYAFDLKKLQFSRWWVVLLFAIVSCALGVILIVDPFAAAKTLFLFIGASLIVDGVVGLITMLIVSFQLRKVKKEGLEKQQESEMEVSVPQITIPETSVQEPSVTEASAQEFQVTEDAPGQAAPEMDGSGSDQENSEQDKKMDGTV